MAKVVRPLMKAFQGLLDLGFGLGVYAGGGFVQDKDAGIAEDGPGNGEALAFTTGDADAPLANGGVVAFREVEDKVVGVGGRRRGDDFVHGGFGFAVGDVLGHGAVEEKGVLEDDPDLFSKGLEADVADVVSVDEDRPFLQVVEPADEVDQGGLACAAVSGQADHLSGLRGEVQVFEDRLSGLVCEGDVGERHPSLDSRHGDGIGFVDHIGLGVQDLKDAFGGGGGALEAVVEAAEAFHRAVELPHIRR